MTATHPAPFQQAMKQSAIGHGVVLAVLAVALAVSQWVTPAKPDEMLMDVSLLLGPPTKGEFGAPNPDAETDQNKNEDGGGAKPENPTPPSERPKQSILPITDVLTPKPPEKPLETKASEVEEKKTQPAKPPPEKVTQKPPEPTPKKQLTNKVVQTEKPQKHEVKVSKEIVSVAIPKNTSQNKLGPSKTTLSRDQLNQMLALGMAKSQSGGAGLRGGGAPGSVERGALGNTMELYKSALKAKLYNAWVRPAGVDGLRTVIRLSIARDGAFISAVIIKRSGNEQMDASTMQAVRTVNPARLPDGVSAPYQIEVEFDASGVSV